MASLTIAHGLPTVLRTPVRRAQRPAARSQHVVRVSASESWINKDIEKDSAKVATMCSSKEIDGKAVFCRCWKSATHNKATGDNVGPLIISMDAAAPSNQVSGPLASSPDLKTDPMEDYCGENADADECRVYED